MVERLIHRVKPVTKTTVSQGVNAKCKQAPITKCDSLALDKRLQLPWNLTEKWKQFICNAVGSQLKITNPNIQAIIRIKTKQEMLNLTQAYQ